VVASLSFAALRSAVVLSRECVCFIVKEVVFSLLLILFLEIFTVILSPLQYEFNGRQIIPFGRLSE